MKKICVLLTLAVGLFGCTKPNYKLRAIEYLKTKIANPASLDTIKFLKPDSIYTSFYGTQDYYHLKFKRDSLLNENNTAEASKASAVLENKLKTSPKKIVGWDVRLIYKAKNKAGIVKTDTCRFTFDSNKSEVRYVSGADILPTN